MIATGRLRANYAIGGAMIEALERRGLNRLGFGWNGRVAELATWREALSEKKPALPEERRARRMSVEPGGEGDLEVVEFGQLGEELAVGLEGLKETVIGGSGVWALGNERGWRPFDPRPLGASASEGAHLGGSGLLLDRGVGGGLVGFPVFAGEVSVGVDGAVRCGEEGEGLHRHVRCELAGPLRPAFKADRGAVLVVATIGGAGGGVARLSDLFGVEAAAPDRGGDEDPTMRWKCMAVALSLREPSKASAMRLMAIECWARMASYSGTIRPKAWATFSATPWWGQSWTAVWKVTGVRVSRLGADLERFVAIVDNPSRLAPWAAGPSPARVPRCG
jgi:hypothetical protein